ncbi:hypothetical protein A9F13_06g01045 [Clavispora lusitaniae]|uniref:LDB19 N-terminal domain-containing protein n=1 Tax=Clavispora lusitaniae TaxID=36911 RepID=A0AA91Q065_CLALS|nr:hypothetical protein A9F13_06g01045 [Clavispora lusitaniae]
MSLLARVLHHHSDRSPRSLTPTNSISPTNSLSSSAPAFSLSIAIESPPLVLFGHAHESTGCILSGVLSVDAERHVVLDSVVLSLVQTFHATKPFVAPVSAVTGCKKCTTRKTELARWDVLTESAPFPPGSHAYPFSHLIPGSVAASTKLGSAQSGSFVKYHLEARARMSGKETVVAMPLHVSRSVFRGADRNSVRVFPPTEITAQAALPGVMYPKSTFPIELRMDNVVSAHGDRRWRMRKLAWRLEERTQVRAHACEKHLTNVRALEASRSPRTESKGLHHSTVQTSMFMGRPDIVPETSQPQGAPEELAGNPESVPDRSIEDRLVDGPFRHPADDSPEQETMSPTGAASNPEQPAPATSPELYLEELRVVAHGEVKSGWKSDFSGRGRIELVAEISALACSTGVVRHTSRISSRDPPLDDDSRSGANVSCDIADPTLGIYVGHVLVVEVIIAEEVVQQKKMVYDAVAPVSTSSVVGVPTGSARVLRMQFKVVVTERSGLGIAWDDEVPPTYEDVSALSPPTYETSTPSLSSTPAVLDAVGSTPVSNIAHVLDLDEHVQEFRL